MIALEKIVEIVAQSGVVSDMQKFDPARSFQENNVDSLDVFTILLAAEEELGVKLSEDEAVAVKSVEDLLRILNSRQ